MACVLVSNSGEMRSKYLISRQNRLQGTWKCQGPSGFREDVRTRNTQWKLLDVRLRSIRTCPDLNHPISHRPDVPTGTYVLSVLSHDYSFDQVCPPFLITSGAHNVYQVRIDVSPEEPLPHVQSYTFGTALLTKSSVSLPYPVVLIPRHKNVYFSPRESFNLLGMFQSPMMMIMVLTGGMMLAMPYIMVSLYRHMVFRRLYVGVEKLGPSDARRNQRTADKSCRLSKSPAKWRSQRVSNHCMQTMG